MPAIWSAAVGTAIGLAYGACSILVAAIALPKRSRSFLVWYLGGVLVRMGVALAAIALVVLTLEVHIPVFVGALLTALIISLILEVLWLLRRRPLHA